MKSNRKNSILGSNYDSDSSSNSISMKSDSKSSRNSNKEKKENKNMNEKEKEKLINSSILLKTKKFKNKDKALENELGKEKETKK